MTALTLRPQPLGIFPLPAGYLVLPQVAGAAMLQAELLGGNIPPLAPAELDFYLRALGGDSAGALAALAGDQSPEGRYNRFVLEGDPAQYQGLRAELEGELALLLDMVAYTLGWSDASPAAGATDGELRAVLLAAQAAQALELGDPAGAEEALASAASAARPTSPLFAAQLLANLAQLHQQVSGADSLTIQHYREALRLLGGSGLVELRAELWIELGVCYQELARGQRGPLLEAVKCYQEALRVFSRQRRPDLYALAQNNLALSYLAMPLVEASDQLRMGIAVQALRETLKIYTRESRPDRWASAQLNLANALQYLPSAHPQENLAEAVQLYEEVLQARDPAHDPLGYARLLANQGNALAHLGIFAHARPKLEEAARLFERGGEAEAAAAVAEALADITGREEQEQHGSLPAPTV